jgi:NADH:ubiquinone oxidoreductase subunit C
MADDYEADIEAGMIRALLGYGLLNVAAEDLVLLVRAESLIYSLQQLQEEGWDSLEMICWAPLEEESDALGLSYRLRSTARRNRTLGVQVQAQAGARWPSAAEIFANARVLEDDLARSCPLTFAP